MKYRIYNQQYGDKHTYTKSALNIIGCYPVDFKGPWTKASPMITTASAPLHN